MKCSTIGGEVGVGGTAVGGTAVAGMAGSVGTGVAAGVQAASTMATRTRIGNIFLMYISYLLEKLNWIGWERIRVNKVYLYNPPPQCSIL
jgi:hypothetical protein